MIAIRNTGLERSGQEQKEVVRKAKKHKYPRTRLRSLRETTGGGSDLRERRQFYSERQEQRGVLMGGAQKDINFCANFKQRYQDRQPARQSSQKRGDEDRLCLSQRRKHLREQVGGRKMNSGGWGKRETLILVQRWRGGVIRSRRAGYRRKDWSRKLERKQLERTSYKSDMDLYGDRKGRGKTLGETVPTKKGSS